MSTSEQNGGPQLTRKQLRELRLTGSTPVISEQEASEAAPPQPAAVLPRAAEPAPIADAPAPTPSEDHPVDADGVPLTRKQIRELERLRAASGEAPEGDAGEEPSAEPSQEEDALPPLVSEVPSFPVAPAPEPAVVPDAVPPAEPAEATGPAVEADASEDEPKDEKPERPMVGEAFGLGVKQNPEPPIIPAVFDDLIDGGSGGSHHSPTALIYTHAPGVGSLSGPVASTGELLITGSYEVPELGSHGHALGTTDGKDIDAVLIDGELAPSSSPTPIAASSAISTSKPAGEVIRPPAPEKGNRLMLTLAIVAGGLAIALAAVLIVAFTTNVFG